VKRYGDWAEFVAGVAPHIDPSRVDALARTVGGNFTADLHGGAMPASRPDLINRYLQRTYINYSESKTRWRASCTVLFAFGFLLLAVPSAMTAVRVALALIGH